MMGGIGAHEYMAPCPRARTRSRWRRATPPTSRSRAPSRSRSRCRAALAAPEDVAHARPDDRRAGRRRARRAGGRAAEGLPGRDRRDELRMVVVRGDHRVNDIKLTNALGQRVPARAPRGDRERDRPAGLHRPGRRDGAGAARPRGRRPRRRLGRGRRRARRATCAASRSAATSPSSRRRPQRRGRRHRRRPRDPHRAGDRDRQHLQARHALLRAARRDVPRRERQGAVHLDGLLRHRPGAHRRGRDRADRRRAGHLLAARARAVAGPPRQRSARRARRSARRPSALYESCSRPGSRSSTTTGTPARARSSPTPSCSAARCG